LHQQQQHQQLATATAATCNNAAARLENKDCRKQSKRRNKENLKYSEIRVERKRQPLPIKDL